MLKTASSFVLSESNLIKTIIFQLIRLRSSNNSTLKEIKLAVEFHNPQIFWFPLFKKSYLRFCDQIYTKFYIFHHQAMPDLRYWIKSSSVHHYWCPKHSNAHVIVFDSPSSWMIASNSKPQNWNFRDRRGKKDLCYGYLHSFEKGRVLPGLKQICSFLILHQCHISQSFQANRPHGIACFNDIIKIKHLQKRRTVKVLAGNYLFGDLQKSHPFYW